MKKRVIPGLLFLLLTLSLPGTVLAQAHQGQAEITFYGAGSILNVSREGPRCEFCIFNVDVVPPFLRFRQSLASSIMFGLKVAYYATDRVAVEGNFAISPNHKFVRELKVNCPPGKFCVQVPTELADFHQEEDIVAYHYDINVAYHFTTHDVRPYFVLGIGGVSYDIPGGFETNFAFNAGIGLKLYVNRIGLRVEINEHIIPDHFLSEKTVANTQFQFGFIFIPF